MPHANSAPDWQTNTSQLWNGIHLSTLLSLFQVFCANLSATLSYDFAMFESYIQYLGECHKIQDGRNFRNEVNKFFIIVHTDHNKYAML